MRNWLKKERERQNLTQAVIASKAGISRTYYVRIENSIRGQKLPVQTAKAIAGVLNVEWWRFYDE